MRHLVIYRQPHDRWDDMKKYDQTYYDDDDRYYEPERYRRTNQNYYDDDEYDRNPRYRQYDDRM